LLVAVIGAAGCSSAPEPVELAYTYAPSQPSRYTLEARAHADWDIGGRGVGSYRATYAVREDVESTDAEGAILSVEMRPREISEDNLPAPARRATSFRLRIGRDGSVREVLDMNGTPAAAMAPDELVFLGTFRPPLPGDSVRPGDTWRAASTIGVSAVFRQIVTRGSLQDVERTPSSTLAALSYEGGAPLVWSTSLGDALAEMSGSADTRGRAIFDVDRGRLDHATSSTKAVFDVRVLPRGSRPPLTGDLELQLELRLTRRS
jgi:hypothetical protein